MADNWVIEAVYENEGEWGVVYEVACRRPDGVRVARLFSEETLEHRSAEYGLDPEVDLDELIEMVLYEFHIPDANDPKNFETDEAAQVGLTAEAVYAFGRTVALGDPVPMTLANAPTTADARKAHRARVEGVKKKLRYTKPTVSLERGVLKPADPLQLIRDNCHLDPDRIREKAERVKAVREGLRRHRDENRGAQKGRPQPVRRERKVDDTETTELKIKAYENSSK